MRDDGKTLSFAPRLPSRLARLSFGILYRGQRLRVDIRSDAAHYELLDGKPVEIVHHGETITVTPDAPLTRALPPSTPRPAPQPPPGRSPRLGIHGL
jgi:alpha,alpha-trehalose phosphorylase